MNKLLTSICQVLFLALTTPLMAAESGPGPQGSTPYYVIEEPFTINFQNQTQEKMRYLQIRVALKSDEPAIIESARVNLPMIQDALRILFTDQNYDTVSSVSGREQLQQQATDRIRSILQQETGSNGLEQVYFTRFILQ